MRLPMRSPSSASATWTCRQRHTGYGVQSKTRARHVACEGLLDVGGMSDAAWRIFDLLAAAVLTLLILILVAPAGRAAAILAALAVLLMHLLLGPFAAGQRDFLMSIPAVAAAWASARAAETRSYRP